MIVDVVASRPHYADHLRPVWEALDPDERGSFVWAGGGGAMRGDTLLAASWSDVNSTGRRHKRRVLMEHGVGQSYGNGNPHYAGGAKREKVSLFLAPNERVLVANQRATPDAEHVLIGTPKLDRWFTGEAVRTSDRTLAISFHWDGSGVCPEAGSAHAYFREAVEAYALDNPGVLGHGHPRAWAWLQRWWEATPGVTPVRSFDDVLRRARVYACDNSSSLFEFAAVAGPVVVMNSLAYRRHVDHGLRFWEYADVGPNADPDLESFRRAVEDALLETPQARERRLEVSAALYPVQDGSSSLRAVEAMRGIS